MPITDNLTTFIADFDLEHAKRRRAAEARTAATNDFVQRAHNLFVSAVTPAFKELGEYLGAAGHDYEIVPAHAPTAGAAVEKGITFKFFPLRQAGTAETSTFRLYGDLDRLELLAKTRTVKLNGEVREGDSGGIPLDTVTPEWVAHEIANFLRGTLAH